MTKEESKNDSQVMAIFEVNVRPDANMEEALGMQQSLHELARNTPAIGEIEGQTWTREDGALMTVYTFQSQEAKRKFVHLPEHVEAMRRGKEFFTSVRTQIATVEKKSHRRYDP